MKTITTWTPPVAVSLLLHATVLVLVVSQMSAPPTEKKQLQTITVELLGQAPVSASKPQVQASKPVIPVQPAQEPAAVVSNVTQDIQANVAIPEKAIPSSQESNSVTASQTSAMAVYPLSKLTRPPSFLRKIEPDYPAAERRAGSQASVLAEVTIDDKGNVLGVRIVKSAGKFFDDAVMDALKKSMFVPGYIDKEAVAVRVLVPFRFNLN